MKLLDIRIQLNEKNERLEEITKCLFERDTIIKEVATLSNQEFDLKEVANNAIKIANGMVGKCYKEDETGCYFRVTSVCNKEYHLDINYILLSQDDSGKYHWREDTTSIEKTEEIFYAVLEFLEGTIIVTQKEYGNIALSIKGCPIISTT